MSKIIQVINAMISNPDKITNVVMSVLPDDEYYFLYNNKYRWSIAEEKESIDTFYNLFIYPATELDTSSLANNMTFEGKETFIKYSTKVLKSQEAVESFKELFNIVKSKLFGIDEIFSNILEE